MQISLVGLGGPTLIKKSLKCRSVHGETQLPRIPFEHERLGADFRFLNQFFT